MGIPVKVRRLVEARDESCWHCGTELDLVPHHRINRGMGGSKLLDTPDNLMRVCTIYNQLMESDVRVQSQARGWGHKLAVWEGTDRPVFHVTGGWWILGADGSRVGVETSERW